MSIFGDFDEYFDDLMSSFSQDLNQARNWYRGTVMWTGPDGKIYKREYVSPGQDEAHSDFDPTLLKDEYQKKLAHAIESENYEDAIKYRDLIKEFDSKLEEYKKLATQKKELIANQDFESVIELNKKLNNIFNEDQD